jgi:hypothetical protein
VARQGAERIFDMPRCTGERGIDDMFKADDVPASAHLDLDLMVSWSQTGTVPVD